MPLNESEIRQVSAGTHAFYRELEKLTGGPNAACQLLLDASDGAHWQAYSEILGQTASGVFVSAFDTLQSLTPQGEVVVVQGAGPRSMGNYVLRALHRRICANQAISASVKKAIAEATAHGAKVTVPSAENLAVGAAAAVSVTIATTFSGPIAVALSPLIGGVALLIVQCGLDAFCAWAEENAPAASAPRSRPVAKKKKKRK